jgi:hypothetical protein
VIRYLRRLAPATVAPAIFITAIFGVRIAISYFDGRVAGGTPLNIAARIAGIVLLIAALSFLWAAANDWLEQREARKRR